MHMMARDARPGQRFLDEEMHARVAATQFFIDVGGVDGANAATLS